MAQRVVTKLIDDLDGSEATRTVRFTVDGKSYVVDLNDKHAEEFHAAVAPYVAAGRVQDSGGSRPHRNSRGSSDGPSATELREWAQANGHHVSSRGRISRQVRDAYAAAH